MFRSALIAAVSGVMLAALPAYAQTGYAQDGELDGAPPPLQIPKSAAPTPKPATPVPKPAPRAVIKPAPADSNLKAEQARLDRLAAELAAQKARLDAREIELAELEKRLTRERADQDADYARKLAELDQPRATSPLQPFAPARVRITYDDARNACTRAGMSEAMDNDFYSARYDGAPRFDERRRDLRGRMRMDDRRGYLTVDTVCQLDANGAVLRFEVLR
jgi:hypothetical protein